jgi:8-oxo-dGTP pyrophosphatase MutT (NUDIX family)
MHLPLPVAIVQVDDRIFANLWLHEIESYFEEITGEHPWYPLIESYIATYFDPEQGRKYAAGAADELLELYDHDRIPRGIYPRASFYDTDHSQLVVWAFVFDRQGRLLIHRRSDNAKDNQGMWDKSVGGHVEFTDYHTSRAAYREVIEELFTEEPEDVKSDLRKWKISDEEVIYLGDWRPDQRGRFPFQEIRSYEREWAFFRLREVEGFERLYSPRTLPNGSERRLRVIPDIFLFVAGPGLDEDFLRRLKNSTYKLTELTHLKSVMDRAIAKEEVPGFDENRFDEDKVNAIPKFTPDLRNIMTGKLRDILEDFSQYIKRYIAT